MAELKLTSSELRLLIIWAENTIHGGHFGDGDVILPEEDIVLKKIKQSENKIINVNERDLRVIFIWAENSIGSTLEGMTGEEISLINKLKELKKQ